MASPSTWESIDTTHYRPSALFPTLFAVFGRRYVIMWVDECYLPPFGPNPPSVTPRCQISVPNHLMITPTASPFCLRPQQRANEYITLVFFQSWIAIICVVGTTIENKGRTSSREKRSKVRNLPIGREMWSNDQLSITHLHRSVYYICQRHIIVKGIYVRVYLGVIWWSDKLRQLHSIQQQLTIVMIKAEVKELYRCWRCLLYCQINEICSTVFVASSKLKWQCAGDKTESRRIWAIQKAAERKKGLSWIIIAVQIVHVKVAVGLWISTMLFQCNM